MSAGFLKVVERAKREPEGGFHSPAHLIDVPALKRAYRRMRKDAAAGVDGVTKEQYGTNLDGNLRDLHRRMTEMKWRHKPIRRVHIPKDKGKTRPIGISAFELQRSPKRTHFGSPKRTHLRDRDPRLRRIRDGVIVWRGSFEAQTVTNTVLSRRCENRSMSGRHATSR